MVSFWEFSQCNSADVHQRDHKTVRRLTPVESVVCSIRIRFITSIISAAVWIPVHFLKRLNIKREWLTGEFELPAAGVAVVFRSEVSDGVVPQVGRSKYHIVGPAGTFGYTGKIRRLFSVHRSSGRAVADSPLLTTLDNRGIGQNLPNTYTHTHAQVT